MKDLQAVLFDLDGTLIDSEYFYYSNWSPILAQEFDLHISYAEWIEFFAGHTLVRNVAFLKEKWGIETTQEFMWDQTRANYAKADMCTIKLMPFANDILRYLKSKDIRMGLVTSSYQTTVDTVLGHHGLKEFFEFFVTRECVENPKPHREPYELAVHKLGLAKQQIIAVEDTITGYTAASASGLTCVAISKHEAERSRLLSASYLLNNLEEFQQLLERDKE